MQHGCSAKPPKYSLSAFWNKLYDDRQKSTAPEISNLVSRANYMNIFFAMVAAAVESSLSLQRNSNFTHFLAVTFLTLK